MPPGFSRLSVIGYRRLKIVDIPLRPMNVLIGANGVGKTSFLDVIGLLAASAEGRLQAAVTELGGMASLLTADGKTNTMDMALRMTQESSEPLDYQIKLSSAMNGYVISYEAMTQQRDAAAIAPFKYIDAAGPRVRYRNLGAKNFIEPNWDYKSQETALSQVPKLYREAEDFRRRLADVSDIYHGLDVSARAPVRTPQTISPAETPGPDGADLTSCLYTIREMDRERFDAVEAALRAAFPGFERLDFPPVAAGRISLGWREHGFNRSFYAGELSEGTLRFLWLAALLQSPGLPEVTLIDEPEVGLHPEMLRLLVDLMREASARSQLIVATHSDRLVRFLEPNELLVCDLDEQGGMTTQWADGLDLKAWMEDYTLDQIWSQGILGGRS